MILYIQYRQCVCVYISRERNFFKMCEDHLACPSTSNTLRSPIPCKQKHLMTKRYVYSKTFYKISQKTFRTVDYHSTNIGSLSTNNLIPLCNGATSHNCNESFRYSLIDSLSLSLTCLLHIQIEISFAHQDHKKMKSSPTACTYADATMKD